VKITMGLKVGILVDVSDVIEGRRVGRAGEREDDREGWSGIGDTGVNSTMNEGSTVGGGLLMALEGEDVPDCAVLGGDEAEATELGDPSRSSSTGARVVEGAG